MAKGRFKLSLEIKSKTDCIALLWFKRQQDGVKGMCSKVACEVIN
jgi:hypothetical protein